VDSVANFGWPLGWSLTGLSSSQSHNRYTYVWNNPATLTDPTGVAGTARRRGASALSQRDLSVATTSTYSLDASSVPSSARLWAW
jgi:hypothetical protein